MTPLRHRHQQVALDQPAQVRARRLRRYPGHARQLHRGVGPSIHQLQQHGGTRLVPDQGTDTDKGTGGVDHAPLWHAVICQQFDAGRSVSSRLRGTVLARNRETCREDRFDPSPPHHPFGPVPRHARAADDHVE